MAHPLRVLIVEDSEDDSLLLVRELRRGGFEPVFRRVDTEETLEQALKDAQWDLVLSDYSMPSFDGISAFQVVRERSGDLPFIFVSGKIGELRAVDAMKRGVNDYVFKDKLNRLIPAIQRELREAEDRRSRREAEAALRRSEERLRQLVSGSIQGIVVHRFGRPLFANHADARIFGYANVEELLALPSIEATLAPHERARLRRYAEARLRGEPAPGQFEFDGLRKDGSRIRVEVLSTVIDWDGEPAVLSTHIDISARKAAEAALLASEQRFKDFAGIASDWMWEMDPEFRFTYVSERLLEITGLSADRYLGKRRWDFAAVDPEKMAQHKADLEAHRSLRDFTYPSRKSDGTLFFGKLNGNPVFDAAGRFLGYRGTGTDVTAEMTARLEAERAHQRLIDAIESVPAAFMLYDREERFVLGNSKTNEFFPEIAHLLRPGVTFEERVRRSLAQGHVLIPEGKTPEQFAEEILAQFRDPPPFREYLRASRRWIRAYDRKTQDGGTVCIRVDITDLKEREERIRHSEEHYRQLVEGSIQGLIVHRNHRPLYINSAFARMHGYASPEDALGVESALAFVHPSEHERILEYRDARMRGADVPARYEYRALRKDGSSFWVENISTVIQWEGEPAIQATFADVTERYLAEEALRQREQFYRAVLENAHDIIAVSDAEARIRFISPSVTTLLGYTPEELQGHAVIELVHEEDRGKFLEALARIVEKPGAAAQQTFRLLHKNGTWRLQEAAARNLLHDAAVGGLIVNSRDITERRELESQLNAAQRMESIGQLAGGVAHDFNNLLAVILSFAELVLDDMQKSDPARDDMKQIIDAANRAAALTRQLLAFSRRQVQRLELLDINATIRDMGKMLQRLIGEDVELITHLDPGITPIRADPSQIEQIVMNLAVNARDAMPRGGKLIIETAEAILDEDYVARHHGALPGPHVMLAITDTGTGMTPAVQARIFEPFFTTKEVGKGTGLGLATVYGIVKQSKGSIWVYSEPGKGSTFRIYLPQGEGKAESAPAAKGEARSAHSGATILLVEDDEHVRMAAQRILEQAGYRLLVANGGAEALAIVDAHPEPIGLLLTDVVMPRMSGRELAERLAAIRPGLNTLFMSGYTDDAILHHGILAEGVELLQKPFTRESLLRNVRARIDAAGR